MRGLLQQKAYSQQSAQFGYLRPHESVWQSNRVQPAMIPSVLRKSCWKRDKSSNRQTPMGHKKPFTAGFFSTASNPPWRERALLISQSRQIRVARRWMQRVDPTTDSRRGAVTNPEQPVTDSRSCFRVYSLSSVQERALTPSNSHCLDFLPLVILWDLWKEREQKWMSPQRGCWVSREKQDKKRCFEMNSGC